MFETKAVSLQSFEHSNIMSMVEYRPWKINNNNNNSLCKEAGFKGKTSHCLRVTCASSLFNAGVEEKLLGTGLVIGQTLHLSMKRLVKLSLLRFLRCWRLSAALAMKK